VEGDREHFAFQSPYVLLPTLESNAVTDPLIEKNYYALLPVCQGLTVGETAKGTVTKLLTTSDSAFAKADGYAITTYDREEGDTDGPFAVAVSVEDNGGGEVVWFACSDMLDATNNAYSSGANMDLAMNALSELIGETDTISIRSKSMGYNYLTINNSQSAMLKLVMIGVLPCVFLITGISVIVERRRMRKHG